MKDEEKRFSGEMWNATYHKVLQLDEVTTVPGDIEMVVKLLKRDNTVFNGWTTKIIKENLLKTCEKKRNMYIMRHGKRISKKSKNCYYDLKITCK